MLLQGANRPLPSAQSPNRPIAQSPNRPIAQSPNRTASGRGGDSARCSSLSGAGRNLSDRSLTRAPPPPLSVRGVSCEPPSRGNTGDHCNDRCADASDGTADASDGAAGAPDTRAVHSSGDAGAAGEVRGRHWRSDCVEMTCGARLVARCTPTRRSITLGRLRPSPVSRLKVLEASGWSGEWSRATIAIASSNCGLLAMTARATFVAPVGPSARRPVGPSARRPVGPSVSLSAHPPSRYHSAGGSPHANTRFGP